MHDFCLKKVVKGVGHIVESTGSGAVEQAALATAVVIEKNSTFFEWNALTISFRLGRNVHVDPPPSP